MRHTCSSTTSRRSGGLRRLGLLTSGSTLCIALAGCGAKTGLWVPDVVDVVDAAMDAPPDAICIEPAPDAHDVFTVDLATDAQVTVADVLFVIDRTGSMDEEIANIRNGLQTVVVPGLVHALPDLHLGVVTFADFPVDPYGAPGDSLFTLERGLSNQFSQLQGVIGHINVANGGDNPEGDVEALYQVATGEGLDHWVPRAGGCPSIGTGYACFRPGAEQVIILITDAPFHNGPGGSNPYARAQFAPYGVPHTYDQMVTALRERLHARVIGINSGVAPFWGRDDLVHLATDTGAVDDHGQPLVYDINPDGSGLSEQVVSSVRDFTQQVLLNVSAQAVDIDGSGGASLVTAVVPQSASPMSNVQRIQDGTFWGVVPGTHLSFGLEIDRSRITPSSQEQRFMVRVQFLSDGRPTLGYRDVEIVIPPSMHSCNH
jgi:hypothetical protein